MRDTLADEPLNTYLSRTVIAEEEEEESLKGTRMRRARETTI
jgi:hypothetical protein